MKRYIGMGARARTPDDQRAAAVVREAAHELIASIRNTLNYFTNTKGEGQPVGRIVLAGAGSALDGFRDALAEATGAPVGFGDPFAGARRARGIEASVFDQRGASLAVAWGLAAGGRAA